MEILRSLVCTRPGSLVIHIILQALLAATKYSEITSSLCHNSGMDQLCYVVHISYVVYQALTFTFLEIGSALKNISVSTFEIFIDLVKLDTQYILTLKHNNLTKRS